MSAEDLERYETEIELQLYREYRDVLPMFQYVVETERRFYLANEVKLDVRNEQRPGVLRARAARRLGVGHVPPGPLRRRRPRRDVQGRQHRGASRQGPLSAVTDARRVVGAAGEDAVARVVRRARATRSLDRNWRVPRGRARPRRSRAAGASCSAR